MRRIITAVLLLCGASVAQSAVPTPGQVPQQKQLLNNNRVVVSVLNLPAGDATPMHKHDKDTLTVFVSGGELQVTAPGKAAAVDKMEAGEVRFRNSGITHSTKNLGASPFVAVIVEFADAQGKLRTIGKKSQTCAPDSKACLVENELFCTEKVCVEDVVMAPGSVTIQHSHATDHMLVAVSDYELTDEVEGKGTVVRKHKSGEVEYIPAGIMHRLTNTGQSSARFTVILWK